MDEQPQIPETSAAAICREMSTLLQALARQVEALAGRLEATDGVTLEALQQELAALRRAVELAPRPWPWQRAVTRVRALTTRIHG
jgi:ABC-type nitrate/sulfonate/bicarbonate transport system substrate-binding protein